MDLQMLNVTPCDESHPKTTIMYLACRLAMASAIASSLFLSRSDREKAQPGICSSLSASTEYHVCCRMWLVLVVFRIVEMQQ